MRADAALADRRSEVRNAARAWRRAGLIEEGTLSAIASAYPDDRARLGPIFRTVAFVFSLLALTSFFGAIVLTTSAARALGVACLAFAVVLVAATEVLLGPLKRADSGAEAATGLLAFAYALVGAGVLLREAVASDRAFVLVLLALALVIAGLGSVRWGSSVLAAIATASAFLWLARLPAGRLWWVLLAVLAFPLLLQGSESRRLPPAHRRSLQWSLVVSLAASYLAVNLASWDRRWLEWLVSFREDGVAALPWARPVSIVATALVPLFVLGFGVATRRGYLMSLGLLLGVASLSTLRVYVHLAPLWAVLVASGGAALLTTLALRRLLASGVGKERAGFTAEPLFQGSSRRDALELAAVTAAFTPAASAVPAEGRLQPGGGRYGGGGATGEF